MPRRKSTTGDDPSAPTFEAALTELEAIVEAMEHEQLPLEDLMTCYEQGAQLLDRCEALLQSARGRIELITLRNKTASESATEATPDFSLPSAPAAASNDDDDIRLF